MVRIQAEIVMFNRANDGDCPSCGCQQSDLSRRSTRWGQPVEYRRCTHCGGEFVAAPAAVAKPTSAGEAVAYHVMTCPACSSDQVITTSTQRPVRYHRCKACDHNFKSVEEKIDK